MKLYTYLNFDGRAEEAMGFYQDLFGAEVSSLMRFSDAPGEMDFPKALDDKIMHSTLTFSGCTFHISDSMQGQLSMGNAIHLSISTDSEEEAHALFAGLSAGGTVTMALGNVFWGGIFGMVTDKFGVQWMVSAHENS